MTEPPEKTAALQVLPPAQGGLRPPCQEHVQALKELLGVHPHEGKGALAALNQRLASLLGRMEAEGKTLDMSWQELCQQLAHARQPMRQTHRRVLRLASSIFDLAPRLESALACSARTLEDVAQIAQGLERHQRLFAENKEILTTLRQQFDHTRDRFQQAKSAAQHSLAGLAPRSEARRQAILGLRPPLVVLAAAATRCQDLLDTGQQRQQILGDRIARLKDEFTLATMAQQANAANIRKFLKTQALLKQQLEMEARAAETEIRCGVVSFRRQRTVCREGSERAADIIQNLVSASTQCRLLEDERLALLRRLESFCEELETASALPQAPEPGVTIPSQPVAQAEDSDAECSRVMVGSEEAAANAAQFQAMLSAKDKVIEDYRHQLDDAMARSEDFEATAARLQERVEKKERMLVEALTGQEQVKYEAALCSQVRLRLRKECDDARREAEKLRRSLSFQLGYLLNHSFQTWSSFLALPGGFLELRCEAKRRREAKAARQSKRG